MSGLVAEEHDRQALLDMPDVRPAKLAHVVFRSSRFDEMCAFYQTFLNARVAWESPMICFMAYDDEHHRVVVIRMPDLQPAPPRSAGLEHYAFTYATMGELLGNYRRLKAAGIHPAWCINHGFTTSIYYRDPDGNMIETQFDNMPAAEADAFMRGEYFAKNPIGVDFDPERLLDRYLAGDPIGELARMKSAPYAADVPHIRPMDLPPYDADGELL